MRRVLVAVLALLVATAAMAQVRGKGRLQGTVTDESGKPVAGAAITVAPADGNTTPIKAKSDAKGRWSALGLTSGQWNVDIEAPGYQPSRGTANVSEIQMLPPIKTTLQKAVEEAEVPASAIETAPSVPQEAVDAVNAGQAFMEAQKFKEAVAEFEKALVHLADNASLKQVLSQAYYKAGELPKAIAMMEGLTAADPSNTQLALLLTNLYLENGQLDQGRALLQNLPAGSVTDPTVYVNVGILFLNKNNPADALTYFGKAVDLDMTRPESYYYRGLAAIQLKKMAEARADFQKVVELAPDSPEGRDAKQMLADLK
ncbi:MAG TPA: tetratricopeptide repeat protein [Thermoanaerobaculia bacterium]|nr:tetratricopeptide repeat protein [Thermoanaerobaculia bacterium]